jgi:hypothetical protein
MFKPPKELKNHRNSKILQLAQRNPKGMTDGIEGLGGNQSVNVSTPLVLSIRMDMIDTPETPTSTRVYTKVSGGSIHK